MDVLVAMHQRQDGTTPDHGIYMFEACIIGFYEAVTSDAGICGLRPFGLKGFDADMLAESSKSCST